MQGLLRLRNSKMTPISSISGDSSIQGVIFYSPHPATYCTEGSRTWNWTYVMSTGGRVNLFDKMSDLKHSRRIRKRAIQGPAS